jgi:hypothetical protein
MAIYETPFISLSLSSPPERVLRTGGRLGAEFGRQTRGQLRDVRVLELHHARVHFAFARQLREKEAMAGGRSDQSGRGAKYMMARETTNMIRDTMKAKNTPSFVIVFSVWLVETK